MIDTPEQRRAFRELIAGVYAYYRKDLSKFVLELWWNGCAPYELEVVQAILSEHMQDPDRGGYLPMVHDITRALRGTASDRAAIAWGKVVEAIGRVGQYTDVVFEDPAIHCAIADMGGWPRLCRIEPKDLGYELHRFAQFYRAYSKALPPAYPRVLVGDRAADEEWAKRGLKPPVKAWGNKSQCRLVYEGRADCALPAAAPLQQLEHQS